MKSKRSLAELAAKALANEARQAPERAPEARERTVAAIAQTIRNRKRRDRLRGRGFAALAIAASIAIAVGINRTGHTDEIAKKPATASAAAPAVAPVASFVRGTPLVVRQGTRRPLTDGAFFEPGDRVVVEPGSRMTIAFASGTFIVVDDRADVSLVSAAPSTIFELDSGSIRADVAKRAPNERFIVRTADAEVEVHGTSFEVSRVAPDPSCGNGTTTRVSVREGIVTVRAGGVETLVHPTETWPKDCTLAVTLAPAPATPSPMSANASASSSSSKVLHVTPPPPSPASTSTLAEQNDRFQNAVALNQAGNAKGAVAAFDDFLVRYPNSPLAQGAHAERMKLLRGFDPERARAAARTYLALFPNGYSRSDAELILSGQ